MYDDGFLSGFMAGQGSDRNDGFGGEGGWIWFIVLIVLFGGYGNGGFGGGNAALQGALTRADLSDGFNFAQLENGIRGIQQGICDSTYALNTTLMNGFHGVDNALCSGFNNVNNNITQSRFDAQKCCCETQRLIERGFCDVITAGQANTQRIIDTMTQDKMQDLRDRLSEANLQLSQQAQSASLISILRPSPTPAYLTCSPYESALMYSGYGRGCGCGC